MRILHLVSTGGTGGIEKLLYEYAGLSKMDNIFIFIFKGGYYADLLEKDGYKLICLNGNNRNKIATVVDLFSIVKKINPDVIVDQHRAPLTSFAVFLIKQFNRHIKLVSYMHCNAQDQLAKTIGVKPKIINLLNYLELKITDVVIAISESVKKSTIELLHYKGKIEVVYNGIDQKPFNINKDCVEKKGKNILYVGRLIRQKGVQNTIEVLKKLDHEVEFQVVGDGEYRNYLESICGEKKKYISFLGTRNDIPDIMKSAGIFVHLPDWEEGFGISIVEAMASGCVCVCYDSGGISEIIDDEENGYLIPKGDIEKAVQVLNRIIDNIESEEILKIRKKAIEKARLFSIERYTQQLDKILQGL